ncbi:Methyltransferase tpcH [Colletotrichum fructicola Nara gc5]|uniref:Methyltransferase tpcH n=1 Tax=Colletotrichum fructicola (strain Nara gc5) TaxID=1213859 RepID=A0A7J6J244_COLFN|nr:Methyltransferase tpcH [Colletotrichum fructicola Nara gc5]
MASPLLTQMGITNITSQGIIFFDNACGTGVLTQELQSMLTNEIMQKSSFLCADKAQNMVDMVKKRVTDEGWTNTKVTTLDAMKTSLSDDTFTHIGLGMSLHMIPDPDAVLNDCKRLLKPGGILGATTFHRNNIFWVPDMRSAFASFPFTAPFPEEVPMQLHAQGVWTDPMWIEEYLRSQGFQDVVVKVVARKHHVKNAQDFVATFGVMLRWFLASWWDEETRTAHPVSEVRELVEKHLEEKYNGDGWDVEWTLIVSTPMYTAHVGQNIRCGAGPS